MNSEAKVLAEFRPKEGNGANDGNEEPNEAGEVEHGGQSAEGGDLTGGLEGESTGVGGAACNGAGKEEGKLVIDGNSQDHSDVAVFEQKGTPASSAVGGEVANTGGNVDPGAKQEIREVSGLVNVEVESAENIREADGTSKKEVEIVGTVKNESEGGETSVEYYTTESINENGSFVAEPSSESEDLRGKEKIEAVREDEDFESSGSEFFAAEKSVLEKELEMNTARAGMSNEKEAVSNGKEVLVEIDVDKSDKETTNSEMTNIDTNDKVVGSMEPNTEDSCEKEWVDILGNGLLKKKIISKGKGQETRPKPGNEVTMVINGELMDGTKLQEETVVFLHDDREMIQAFELGVALMEEGEKAVLYTDAKYAYGPFGCDSVKIPKNCNITYTLEIVSIKEGPDKDKISDDERVQIGDKKRAIGNGLYSRGDYGSAIDCYKRALKYLDGSANKSVIDMKVKCQNNLSAAQLKVNAYQAALSSCNVVLTLETNNIKAMFRKSKCLEALGKQDEALKCLKEASMIDPSNKLVYNDLMRLSKYVKKSLEKESDMYKRMVGGVQKKDENERINEDSNFSFKLMVGTLVVAGLGILTAFVWNRH